MGTDSKPAARAARIRGRFGERGLDADGISAGAGRGIANLGGESRVGVVPPFVYWRQCQLVPRSGEVTRTPLAALPNRGAGRNCSSRSVLEAPRGKSGRGGGKWGLRWHEAAVPWPPARHVLRAAGIAASAFMLSETGTRREGVREDGVHE